MDRTKVSILILLILLGAFAGIALSLSQRLNQDISSEAKKMPEPVETLKPTSESKSDADRYSAEMKKIRRINSRLSAALAQIERDYIVASTDLTREFSGSLQTGLKTVRQDEIKLARINAKIQAIQTAQQETNQILETIPEIKSNRRSPPLYNERTRDVCQWWEEFARGEDSICLQSIKRSSWQVGRWMTRRANHCAIHSLELRFIIDTFDGLNCPILDQLWS